MPTIELVRVLNTQLVRHRLELPTPHGCRLLRSRGLVTVAFGQGGLRDPEKYSKIGFWVCPLKYPVEAPVTPKTQPGAVMGAVFAKLEQQCPRFFAPGQTDALQIPGGEMRTYADSEMKVYVFDGGAVLYKYYRTLNPVRIGSVDDVLSGKAKIDCSNIRGRSGLPWEREI